MPRHAPAAELAQMLVSRTRLLAAGVGSRKIGLRARDGDLAVVRRGWFAEKALVDGLWPESRHLLHVLAVARDGQGVGIASHASAAVLHGLPLYRVRSARVHLTTDAPRRIASGPDVFRHVAPLPPTDVTTVGGVMCTTLERTVFDCVRSLSLEAAVSIADAAERSMAFRHREWDQDAADRWRHGLRLRIERASGARGIRGARFVADFANGNAQLPLESVSRLQLHRLGFRAVRLQVPVAAPDGGWYFVDLGLDDIKTFGECDGEGKYRDEAMRSGRSLEQVLLDEKSREDWIRGTTGWRLIRWGDRAAASVQAFATRLRAFGIPIPL
jgi:hypothetical protein